MMTFPQRHHVGTARTVDVRVLLHHDGHAAVRQHLERRSIRPLEHVGSDHLPRRAHGDHLSVEAHQRGKVRGDPVQVMRRQHDREALVVQIVYQVHHVVPRAHVHPGRGLVQQQELGAAEHRPRDEHPLLLPAGQLADVPFTEAAEAEALEDLIGFLAFGPRGPRALCDPARAP